MSRAHAALLLLLFAAAGGCGRQDPERPSRRLMVRGPSEPRRVLIDRILITYRGNPFGVGARRSLEEAGRLARSIAERARAGEDFVELRNGYSDDRSERNGVALGPYILMNYGVPIAPTLSTAARMRREAMGRRLGDVAFSMRKDEIALVEYDEEAYPLGYEIIRCLMRDDRTEEQVARDLAKPAK